MDEWKKRRFASQTIHVICAMCGGDIAICNREESDVFSLESSGELFFNCPKCGESYDIPFIKRTQPKLEGQA